MLLTGCVAGLRADSVICSLAAGSGPLVTQSGCNQSFVANDFMNWGAPVGQGGLGEAISPPSNQIPVNVTSEFGVGISVSSNMEMQRADNTEYAWDASTSQWVLPTVANGFAESINTFMGNFGAPSMPTYTGTTNQPAYGPDNYPYQFGDPLLAALPGQIASPGPFGGSGPVSSPDLVFTFNAPLFGIAFRVSSAANQNFSAVLDAYDSSNNLLGRYEVDDIGDGGICTTLSNTSGPVPCNSAPLIQFYDPEGRIANVVLTMNGDPNGMYVDGISLLSSDVGAPEPKSTILIGAGLILFALVSRRYSRSRKAKLAYQQ